MTYYLIEFRFFGRAKKNMKRLIWEINKKFHIRPRHRSVPHVTLVGPFSTRDQRRLVNNFKDMCSKHRLMKYTLDGYGTFEETKVVYGHIEPDNKLDEFRWELSKTLKPNCILKPYDIDRQFNFHATIAMKIHQKKFEKIKAYIATKQKLRFQHILLRVALLRNQKILCEYDFILRRLLTRWEAKNRAIYKKTMTKLNEFFKGTYKPDEFIPLPDKEPITLFEKIKGIFTKHKTFIISDLHLDHKNIIKYCNRPFKSVHEMNKTLIDNWNNAVGKLDIVYFIGDLAFGKGSRNTDYWLKKLNGKIIFLKGNHDKSKNIKFKLTHILEYKGKKFFLAHTPEQVPKSWKGWSIVGHHHNNYPDKYPFINGKTKMINVGVELIDYTPLNMDKLFELEFENLDYKKTLKNNF